MIQSNYFTDNEDLQDHFHNLIDWEEVVKLYEGDFADFQEYSKTKNPKLEMAPSSTEEAVAYYEEILKSVGDISGNYVSQIAKDIDKDGLEFQDGIVTHPQKMVDCINLYHEAGLGPVAFQRRYGGLGLPNVMKAFCSDIMYRSDSSTTIAAGSMGLAVILETIAEEKQKEEWIPKIISQRYTATMGLSEPDFGSDLPSVKTKAEFKNGEWYLTGSKRYQTVACGINGGPGVTLALARTGTVESGARGLSFFLVEHKDYQVIGIEKKLGIKASATCEVVYENSKAHLVGKEGFGLVKYVMGMLNGARLSVSSQGTGMTTAALKEAEKYAKERIQFGKPIIEIPAVKKILEKIDRETSAMRCLMVEAALSVDRYLWDQKKDSEKLNGHAKEKNASSDFTDVHSSKFWEKVANTLTPISKYYNSETANKMIYDALQVFGGAGFTEDYDLARLYRDVRITNIYDGTTQIQVNAAIGGIVSGMSEKGVFRKYLEHLSSFSKLPKIVLDSLKLLEEIVELYKNIPDSKTKEANSFEVVESAARVILSLLMEKAANAKSKLLEKRKLQNKQFHADSLAILEGNKIRLQNL